MTGPPGLAPSRSSRRPPAARKGCQARSDRSFGEGKSKRRDHRDEQKASKARIGWFCLGRRTKLLSGKFQGGKSNLEPRSSTPRAVWSLAASRGFQLAVRSPRGAPRRVPAPAFPPLRAQSQAPCQGQRALSPPSRTPCSAAPISPPGCHRVLAPYLTGTSKTTPKQTPA